MPDRSDELIHLVYDASLDNSIWPELVLERSEQLENVRATLPTSEEQSSIAEIATHFRRAFRISERIVDLQEREGHLNAVLNTFSFGIALIDGDGEAIIKNSAIMMKPEIARVFDKTTAPLLRCPLTEIERSLKQWVGQVNLIDQPNSLSLPTETTTNLLMLPRRIAVRMGFPPKAAAVLLVPERVKATAYGPLQLNTA